MRENKSELANNQKLQKKLSKMMASYSASNMTVRLHQNIQEKQKPHEGQVNYISIDINGEQNNQLKENLNRQKSQKSRFLNKTNNCFPQNEQKNMLNRNLKEDQYLRETHQEISRLRELIVEYQFSNNQLAKESQENIVKFNDYISMMEKEMEEKQKTIQLLQNQIYKNSNNQCYFEQNQGNAQILKLQNERLNRELNQRKEYTVQIERLICQINAKNKAILSQNQYVQELKSNLSKANEQLQKKQTILNRLLKDIAKTEKQSIKQNKQKHQLILQTINAINLMQLKFKEFDKNITGLILKINQLEQNLKNFYLKIKQRRQRKSKYELHNQKGFNSDFENKTNEILLKKNKQIASLEEQNHELVKKIYDLQFENQKNRILVNQFGDQNQQISISQRQKHSIYCNKRQTQKKNEILYQRNKIMQLSDRRSVNLQERRQSKLINQKLGFQKNNLFQLRLGGNKSKDISSNTQAILSPRYTKFETESTNTLFETIKSQQNAIKMLEEKVNFIMYENHPRTNNLEFKSTINFERHQPFEENQGTKIQFFKKINHQLIKKNKMRH